MHLIECFLSDNKSIISCRHGNPMTNFHKISDSVNFTMPSHLKFLSNLNSNAWYQWKNMRIGFFKMLFFVFPIIMPYVFLWTYITILHRTISIIKIQSNNPIEYFYQRLWAKNKAYFFQFTLLWIPRKCMYCVICKARYIILCLSTGSCSKKWWRDPRKRNNSGEANVAKNYCHTYLNKINHCDWYTI